jgi:hypothetical protein
MHPVDFKDKNIILKAPGYGELPALQTKDNCIVTSWEMSEAERKEFEKTGIIWLSVIGLQHPPICMSVEQPYGMFKDEEIEDAKEE